MKFQSVAHDSTTVKTAACTRNVHKIPNKPRGPFSSLKLMQKPETDHCFATKIKSHIPMGD